MVGTKGAGAGLKVTGAAVTGVRTAGAFARVGGGISAAGRALYAIPTVDQLALGAARRLPGFRVPALAGRVDIDLGGGRHFTDSPAAIRVPEGHPEIEPPGGSLADAITPSGQLDDGPPRSPTTPESPTVEGRPPSPDNGGGPPTSSGAADMPPAETPSSAAADTADPPHRPTSEDPTPAGDRVPEQVGARAEAEAARADGFGDQPRSGIDLAAPPTRDGGPTGTGDMAPGSTRLADGVEDAESPRSLDGKANNAIDTGTPTHAEQPDAASPSVRDPDAHTGADRSPEPVPSDVTNPAPDESPPRRRDGDGDELVRQDNDFTAQENHRGTQGRRRPCQRRCRRHLSAVARKRPTGRGTPFPRSRRVEVRRSVDHRRIANRTGNASVGLRTTAVVMSGRSRPYRQQDLRGGRARPAGAGDSRRDPRLTRVGTGDGGGARRVLRDWQRPDRRCGVRRDDQYW